MPNFLIRITVQVTLEAAMRAGCLPLPEGFPFILDALTGAVEHEPTAFLRKLCLSGGSAENMVVSPRTAMCRAVDLKDFCDYLRASKTQYAGVSADVLYRYAGTMANQVSPYTHELYSQLTIGRRCWTAIEFCSWLSDRLQLPSTVSNEISELRRQRVHTQRDSAYQFRTFVRPTLLPTQFKIHNPRILDEHEVRRLLSSLMCASEVKSSALDQSLNNGKKLNAPEMLAIAHRNKLMVKVALCAGLRREEICRLELGNIEKFLLDDENKALHVVSITHTKNNCPRNVLMPASLIRELQSFVKLHRGIFCDRTCKKRCGMGGALFPSSRPSKSGKCIPMNPQNFSLIIRNAAIAAGIVRERPDHKHQARRRITAGMSIHDLRHTYAVWTYLILKSQGDTNPWLYIQSQLGHRSSETTINTYLRMAAMFENSISQSIADYVLKLTNSFTPQDGE